MYKILIEERAQKEFNKIPWSFRQQVRTKIHVLQNFPEITNVKKLQGRRSFFRLRIGQFRVIFKVFKEEKVIKITYIRKRDERTYYNL